MSEVINKSPARVVPSYARGSALLLREEWETNPYVEPSSGSIRVKAVEAHCDIPRQMCGRDLEGDSPNSRGQTEISVLAVITSEEGLLT